MSAATLFKGTQKYDQDPKKFMIIHLKMIVNYYKIVQYSFPNKYNQMNKNNQPYLSLKRKSFNKLQALDHRSHKIDETTLEDGFKQIINIGLRTQLPVKYLRTQFTDKQIEDFEQTRRNNINKLNVIAIIEKVEQVHEKFFVPSLQIKEDTICQKKADKNTKQQFLPSIDNSFMSLYLNNEELRDTSNQSKQISFKKSSPDTKSINKTQTDKSKFNRLLSRRNSPSKGTRQNRKWADSFRTKTYGSSEKKQNNSSFFHLPTQVVIRKVIAKQEKVYPWQKTLLDIMNTIMDTNIISKLNVKIDRDRLSSYLKKQFINQVITTYYKCQPTQTYKTMKGIIQDLSNLNRRQANLIAFFTYDFNGDNFICQEDLYHFLQKLKFNAEIMKDVNLIIQFMRKNKVRSIDVNLPSKIIQKKHKIVVNSIWKENSKVQDKKTSKSFVENELESVKKRFFSLYQSEDEQKQRDEKRQKSNNKRKNQINFDVFNLIFADRMPVLISQIVKRLTQKPKFEATLPKKDRFHSKTEPIQQFLYTRSQGWKQKMNDTQVLCTNAKIQRKSLSYKL